MRLLSVADYRRMPWRNGGGETIEIAVSPQGASVSGFDWRVSMARVESDGPFSMFPGVDRTLAILQGAGLKLHIGDEAPVTLTGGDEPYAFPADVSTSASLIDGPVVDFNVMSRRAGFTHTVRRFELASATDIAIRGEAQLIFCARGQLQITDAAGTARLSEGETLHRFGRATSLRIDPETDNSILLVEIVRIAPSTAQT